MKWLVTFLCLVGVLLVLYGPEAFQDGRFISADGANATAWQVIGDAWLTPGIRAVLLWAAAWSFLAGLICGLYLVPLIERKARGRNE